MMGAAGRDRPNLLIIMSDEHAPMFSSTYGHPLVQTPNMDRLAREIVPSQEARLLIRNVMGDDALF